MMNEANNHRVVSEEIATRTFFRIYQCNNLISRIVGIALVDYRITSQQWAILGVLSNPQAAGGITVLNLSRVLKVSRQNLTAVLSRLEKQKLIKKVTSERDARERLVLLTKTGQEVWNSVGQIVKEIFADLLSGSTFEDNIAFLNRLNTLVEMLSSKRRLKNNKAAKNAA
jgi:MarR family transcriptional regulator, organic hydroperoxide resistance regulator